MTVSTLHSERLVLNDLGAVGNLHAQMAAATCHRGVDALERKAGHRVVVEG